MGAFLFGCGSSHKGLDSPLELSTTKAFVENCFKVHAELKETNPNEFAKMKGDDAYKNLVFDLSQPREQVRFDGGTRTLCTGILDAIGRAASEDNINLKTYRDVHAWMAKYYINQSISRFEYHKKDLSSKPRTSNEYYRKSENEDVMKIVAQLKTTQLIYTALTGEMFGPTDLDVSFLAEEPKRELPINPVAPSSTPVVELDVARNAPIAAEPKPQPASPPAVSSVSQIEQSGLCQGMDLGDDDAKLNCTHKKFSNADKLLNETYHIVMGGLDVSRRSALKNEQIAWIKEKETKCQTGGKGHAGTTDTLASADCKLRFTEQRLGQLKNFK